MDLPAVAIEFPEDVLQASDKVFFGLIRPSRGWSPALRESAPGSTDEDGRRRSEADATEVTTTPMRRVQPAFADALDSSPSVRPVRTTFGSLARGVCAALSLTRVACPLPRPNLPFE